MISTVTHYFFSSENCVCSYLTTDQTQIQVFFMKLNPKRDVDCTAGQLDFTSTSHLRYNKGIIRTMQAHHMKRTLFRLIIIILALLIIVFAGFVIWGSTPLGPAPTALDAMLGDDRVTVEPFQGWMVFKPSEDTPQTGLIIYPGGRVDYRSYAPLAHRIAKEGYLVVLVPMPLNLAVLGVNKAGAVVAAFPTVRYWAIGGHSLGGAMAASYLYNHPAQLQGLVLWASYPARNNPLTAQDIEVVSVYGTLDGLATREKIEASRPLLPATTQWVAVQGGNHAQFGSYGVQPGDNSASIDLYTQQDQVVAATLDLLERISNPERKILSCLSIKEE